VNDARYPPQNCQADVDDEIRIAACLEEDGDGRDEDRKEVKEDVGGGGWGSGHCVVAFEGWFGAEEAAGIQR